MTARITLIIFTFLIGGCASVINVDITKNGVYEYNFGSLGDEQGLEISEQAKHYAISEIIWNEKTYEQAFRYEPEDNFIGNEVVEIKFTEWSYDKNKVVTLEKYKFKIIIKE